ncbi:transcriptional repressor [Streptomyces sp. NRRL B-24720]|uniref:transcriptional repressor n=1 Tax=Streptomyces sp. NRRL B-24720 TaxID=1476876 RepID=UPI001F416B6D
MTAEELRSASLWVTAARVALLEAVQDGDHLGVETITARVRDRMGRNSLHVCETLHALTSTRLVRRIEPAGNPARFEGRTVSSRPGARSAKPPAPVASDVRAFSIDKAEVDHWGPCPTVRPSTVPEHRDPPGPEGFPCLRTMMQSS